MKETCFECEGLSRRGVLKGLSASAVLGVTAVSVASCAPAKTPVPTELTRVASVDEVPVGGGKTFLAGETPVLVAQPEQGRFVAYSTVCPHQGCVVGEDTDNFLCPCHSSGFAFEDGRPLFGPARENLTALNLEVDGQDILVSA